jgi:ADP-ribose pyrophosphatase
MTQPQLVEPGDHINFVRRGTWEYVERVGINGIVYVVALTDADELILIEQYRPPVDAQVIEMVAGLSGDVAGGADEALADAAHRELLEETGYTAGTMTRLAAGAPAAGVCDEVLTVFLARDLERRHAGGGDANEQITVHCVPLAAVDVWLQQQAAGGKLIDLKVYSGLYFARHAEFYEHKEQ